MHLDHQPMRREGVFSKGGAYRFIVEHNLLLHQEAVRVCTKVVADWSANRSVAAVIHVLDLACGGMPIVMNGVMRQFVIHRYDYHGIDINADQIASAREFQFSPNVHATFSEGDCWQPAKLMHRPVDIIFMGLNTHHAVPEELHYLASQLKQIMTPGGLFLNYDLFRPAPLPYLRRPDRSDDGKQSLALITPEILKKAHIAPLPAQYHSSLNWRKNFLTPFVAIMKRHHFPETVISETVSHITERDYPVSTAEMTSIFKGEGFKAQAIPLNSDSPLTPFLNVIAATL